MAAGAVMAARARVTAITAVALALIGLGGPVPAAAQSAASPPAARATPAAHAPPSTPNAPAAPLLGTRTADRDAEACRAWAPGDLTANPSEAELRCRWGITGAGRFGLLSYLDVPVYQTTTPMPGTHLVGVPGHARPAPGESYEGWEWRVHRTEYDGSVRRARRSLEVLHPFAAARIISLESTLKDEGIRAIRRETWRSPDRQAYLFQQGRSRPGPIATATLTSWHSQVDAAGNPAGRAVDYTVPRSQMARFHEIARAMGLATFGAGSNDPGHVFVPDPEPFPSMEVVLLRLLPTVPVVTLATGLPVDRSYPAGGRAALRAAVRSFMEAAHVPAVEAEAVGVPSSAGGIIESPGGSGRKSGGGSCDAARGCRVSGPPPARGRG